jgi:exopolysaccharide biosynthesis polyprenyl glycosylphosphotransferase
MAPNDVLSAEHTGTSASALPQMVGGAALELEREQLTTARIGRARVANASRDAVYRRFLAVADALAAAAALLISSTAVGSQANLVVLATVPLILLMSKVIGTYDRADLLVRKSTLDEAPALFHLATVYALTVWLIDGLLVSGGTDRGALLLLWVALFVLLLVLRSVARSLSRWCTPAERCAVIGDPTACEWIRTKFARSRSLHAAVVAFLAPQPQSDDPPEGAPLTGTDLQALAARLDVDRVMIMPGTADENGIVDVVHAATTVGLKVSVLPRVLEVVGTSVQVDDVEGVPMLSMRPLSLRLCSRMIKRALDVLGSVLTLVVLAPLFAAIAIAIKLDSRGPVLFRQRRVGRDGQDFEMLKFRTMVWGADERKDEVRHLNQADGLFKIAEDPRITPVGRVLRRTCVDELPQLLNVLRGEMSLVGPRPLIVEEDMQVEGWCRRRLQLTPGMTGHWQILGSARLPLADMVRIDYLYVTNWSLWLDFKILLRTVPYVLARKGM